MNKLSQSARSDGDSRVTSCSVRPNEPAAAYCVRCGRPFSGRLLLVAADGTAVCRRCQRRHDVPRLEPARRTGDPALEGNLRTAITRILLKPQAVFQVPWQGSSWPAIRFGFVVSVVGLVFWNAWFWIFTPQLADEAIRILQEQGDQVFTRTQLQHYSWFGIPILAAGRLLFGTLGLHGGFRLAGAPPRSFREHTRVFALSSAALLLCIVPSWVGAFFANLGWLTCCIVFARTRYNFSTARAIAALLPAMMIIFFFPPR